MAGRDPFKLFPLRTRFFRDTKLLNHTFGIFCVKRLSVRSKCESLVSLAKLAGSWPWRLFTAGQYLVRRAHTV